MRYILSLIIFLSFNIFAQSPLLTLMNSDGAVQPTLYDTLTTLDTELVVYFNFDEQTGDSLYNRSPNNTLYDGGLMNIPTWTANGQYGGCLDFNGTDEYVKLNDGGSLLSVNESFTILFWYNRGSVQTNAFMFCKDNSGTYTQVNAGWQSANVFYGDMLGASTPTNTHLTYAPLDTSGVNSWTHIAMRYDGDYFVLFVNGVGVAQVPETINNAYTDDRFSLARYGGYSGYYFDGKLDEFMIFSRALTLPEIEAIYNKQK